MGVGGDDRNQPQNNNLRKELTHLAMAGADEGRREAAPAEAGLRRDMAPRVARGGCQAGGDEQKGERARTYRCRRPVEPAGVAS